MSEIPMDWNAIGAIGQMLGSVAVIVTLGYLAVQVQHARAEVRRSVREGRARLAAELSQSFAADERQVRIGARSLERLGTKPAPAIAALMERAGLTPEEAWITVFQQQAWWQYRAYVIAYIDDLTPGQRIEFDSGLRSVYGRLTLPAIWYEASKAGLNPDAARYVDSIIGAPKAE